MESYAYLMFTPNVRAEQDAVGMGARYAQMYPSRHRGPLDYDAREFIQTRDTAYLATVTETGWPYVQHRGGPRGFIRVIGPERIGFGDYVGNKQFISKGNLKASDRVALILMDYPRRARMKLVGHATMVDAGEDADLAAQLQIEGAPPFERLVTIDVAAMDWNCPKYITPRLTEGEIEANIGPRLRKMAATIEELEGKLDAASPGWREE